MPNVVAPAASMAGLLCCWAIPALTQARPLVEPAEFVLAQWTTADGLPQNSVTAIAQTPDGYLWIGTFGGLARFDGSSFHRIARVDSSGHHTDRVLSLAVGRDSALWIGTEAGLLRYRDGQYALFTTANGLPDDEVSAVHVDRGGAVWIGTGRGGLARFDDGRFARVPRSDGRTLSYVFSIVESADGAIWVNLASQTLVVVAESADTTARVARPVPAMLAMVMDDRAGARWFQREHGLARVRGDSVRIFGSAHGVPPRATMVEDARGGYWLATANDGLFFFRPERGRAAVRQYPLPDGRRRYRVRSAFVDREGNVWFGTDANGLLLARRNLFTTYTSAHGLSHEVMTAVFGDASGVLWAGTNCGGLNAIDVDRLTVRTFKPRKPNDPSGDPCVFALTESAPGTLLAGTWGGGLTRITRGVEERLRTVGLRDSVILALFTARDGTVWVGTNSGGLASLRDGRVVRTYSTADGLAHNSVRTIYQSRDGALWVGTLGGLSRLAAGDRRLTSFAAAQGLSALHVRAIHEDVDGNLWIGTYGGGLNRLRDGAIRVVRQRDGLADDVVSSILEDGAGRLWTSGNLGIARVRRDELLKFLNGEVARVRSVLYGTGDGLAMAETNGGFQPAAWKDHRGRLWFPTVRGVAMIDPTRAGAPELPPAVAVEQVVVNGQTSGPAGELVVGPGRTNLEFRYTGLSLSAPRHLLFRYRLEGFDDEWVDAGTRRVAYYPRLPPGTYRFRVTAANRDGVWNEAGAELPVRVRSTLWGSWRFRVAALGTVLILAAVGAWRRTTLARRWRAAQEDFSRRLIESQEHERRRVAGELHDGLGQELLVIKNRALMALRADGSSAMREQLEHISAVATQSLDGVRGLAHNLTPHQLDHLGLTAALGAMIDSASATVDIRVEREVDDIDALLPVQGQINLFRIVQEAVNNVVRHSQAKSAVVSVRRMDDLIAVTVRDDGRGFHVQRDGAGRLAGGFGLSGIAERARILHGRVDVISAPGQGTRLELLVPVMAVPRSLVPSAPSPR